MTDRELTGQLVKSFHLAITYLKIYPPTSQMVIATFDTLTKTLNAILEHAHSTTLSELSGKLLIDAKEPESREVQAIGANILKLFSQKKIQSITFRQGLNGDELADFMAAILRKKREEIGEFPHIALDQTVYVAMVKGEETVVKISDMVQQAGGDISGLITSIRESYDLIDRLPDEASREQAQDHLAGVLARQDTTALREIFDRDLPPRIESSGLKPRLLNALSQEKIQDIFGNISVWYDEIRRKEGSDFAAVDRLDKLKGFIQAILASPAAKTVPLQFFEDLLRKGLIDQLPAWFSTEPAKPAALFDIEKLLDAPPAELMEKTHRSGLPQIVEKLCQIENNDLLGRLIERVLENLKNPSAMIRLPAADTLAAMYDILAAHSRADIMRFMELPLLETARRETSFDVYTRLIGVLRKAARQNLLFGAYETPVQLVDLLTQHLQPEIMYDEKIRSAAASAKQTLIGEIMDILIADLKSDNEKRKMSSLQVMGKIGNAAVEPLVRVIKESDDMRARRIAAGALRTLGDAAVRRFGEELSLGLTADEMRRVLDVLHELSTENTVQQLTALVRYPDVTVKKDILRFLARTDTSPAKILIIEHLKDPDPVVVAEAVRVLGDIRCAEAVPSLAALLAAPGTPPGLQGDICLALGAIGSFQGTPALIAKLRKRPSLFAQHKEEWEKTRMRAAWALSKFTGGEVIAALEAASKDRSAAVAMTAKDSLAQVRSRKDGTAR